MDVLVCNIICIPTNFVAEQYKPSNLATVLALCSFALDKEDQELKQSEYTELRLFI